MAVGLRMFRIEKLCQENEIQSYFLVSTCLEIKAVLELLQCISDDVKNEQSRLNFYFFNFK